MSDNKKMTGDQEEILAAEGAVTADTDQGEDTRV